MSLLVVGLSHRSAPPDLLDRAALSPAGAARLASAATQEPDIAEVVALATCHRTELYVAGVTFHGALASAGRALSSATGIATDELTPHMFVHYQDRAASHLFSVTCGLESLALGENEVLGQVRSALQVGQRAAQVGPELNPLFQRALRLGKRVRSQTEIGQLGRSLVERALDHARQQLPDLASARTVLVGAGAMSGIAAATLARQGVRDVRVVNRTPARAQALVGMHGGRAVDWADLSAALAEADLVVSCTGAPVRLLTAAMVQQARRPGRPLVLVDLAVPRDIDPEAARVPGVSLWSLADQAPERAARDRAAQRPASETPDHDAPRAEAVLSQVRAMIDLEVLEHQAALRAQEVGPTVAALRERADALVGAELDRLAQRAPDLTPAQRAKVEQAITRVVDKLLHAPTVRARQLPDGSGSADYAHALRELFDLDPREALTVSSPPVLPRPPVTPAPMVPPEGEQR